MLNKETRIEEMNRIASLVFEINGLEARKSRNGIAVFMNVAPHCRWIELRVYKRGWGEGSSHEDHTIKYDLADEDMYSDYETPSEAIEMLEELLEKQKAGDERRAKKQEKKRYDEALDAYKDELQEQECESYDLGDAPSDDVIEIAKLYSKKEITEGEMVDRIVSYVSMAKELEETW